MSQMTEATACTRAGLNKDQMTFFFTNAKQMEVTKETLAQLGHEGIKNVEDLAEFSKDNWKQVVENLKRGKLDEESGQGTRQR
eukprot:6145800-Ditylum_brightwellii.AAC.1